MTSPALTPERIREQVVARLCETLGCAAEHVDPQAPFASFGLGSRDAVVLSGDLEEWLGRPLSPTVFYDYPTVDALVAHLTAVSASASSTADGAARPMLQDAEPVAIVGLSCRFPDAPDADAFWGLLLAGGDGVSRLPASREALIGEALFAAVPDRGRWGGFIGDVDAFDARFFGIGAAEAESMDPQQRLLLELAWHALEDAGQPIDALQGSRTGVFVGISTSDYALLRLRTAGAQPIDTYFGTSNSPSVAAGRLSYVFGLQGPALAVDTACSSSLVAVHLACQSLRRGESDLALAAGVNLMLAPETTLWACHARILSEDGRCKTFDASANGYVRGEGCGVVVLKRLENALRDGDPIVAVIRGSAVNHDGRSSGLTAPNGIAQHQVIAGALADARVAPLDVHCVEAHGTGTILGDPIEVRALGAALCGGRPADDPLVVASVKTNIGHLEAAAGIASLIKMALVVRHGVIPPHLHVQTLNPYIASESLPLLIPAEARPWPADGRQRFAAVSSFGLSGTNAHLVLAPPPKRGDAAPTAPDEGPWMLPVSARSEDGLRARVEDFRIWLDRYAGAVRDACFTACVRRAHHPHRIAVVGRSASELSGALAAWLEGRPHERLVDGRAPATSGGGLPETRSIAGDLAVQFVARRDIDGWDALFPGGGRVVPLPPYRFRRARYWLPRTATAPGPVAAVPVSAILGRLAAAPVDRREEVLETYLREQLARGLQVPEENVPVDAPMTGLGLDSLMAIDLTNRLAAELSVRVPPVDLVEKMTLRELASLVLDLREAAQVQAARPSAGEAADIEEFVL